MREPTTSVSLKHDSVIYPNETPSRRPFSRIQRVLLSGFVLLVLIVVGLGLISRRQALTALDEVTEKAALPNVIVTSIGKGGASKDLILPGATQPFSEAAVYARTNGYLKNWYFDIGSHVQKGQLLATIDTPELDQQLRQAQQDLATAKQNEQLASTTNVRWQNLVVDDAVSKQEAEQFESDYRAKQSTTKSAVANFERLRDLQSFEKLYAPFAGVVTARNTDIGALIDAGGVNPKELFHIASVEKLRIFVTVPEVDLASANPGAIVDLTLDEFPDRVFQGKISRTSDSIDPVTRTLRIEIDLENTKDEIKTGAYILAHFKQPSSSQSNALIVPANALLFRSEGLQVAVVRDGKANLVPIKVGRDFGSSLEVTRGLTVGDLVILNPSDSLTSGTPVKVSSEKSGTRQ